MKRLLLSIILLFSISSKAARVQIDFVTGFTINIINPVPLSPSEGSATTDAAINTIFLNYNINHCVIFYDNQRQIIFVDYLGNDLSAFRNALQSNSNVSKTSICYPNQFYYTFADRLYLYLIDTTNGNPTGINNGIIVTTNSTLNSIFTQYNVTTMSQLLVNSRYYEIFFEGDITGLKNALDAFTSVIDTTTDPTNLVGVPMLLNNIKFDKSKINISPNPFTNNFNIQTEEIISNYTLIDISGKQLITTNSKNELDKLSTSLNSGIYFLNILLENGENGNFKLVKE